MPEALAWPYTWKQGKIQAPFHHYRPLVEMHERAGLEYLSVDASEADDHHALLLLKASDSAGTHDAQETCRDSNDRHAEKTGGLMAGR